MQLQITLSKKEKRHYFIYLAAMLLMGVIFLSVLFLYKSPSPFATSDVLTTKDLQQKVEYEKRERIMLPIVDSTFQKLKKISVDEKQSRDDYGPRDLIKKINKATSDLQYTDDRKEIYPIIAKFYTMYVEDKKIMLAMQENLKRSMDQRKDCEVGIKEKQNQINAIIGQKSGAGY